MTILITRLTPSGPCSNLGRMFSNQQGVKVARSLKVDVVVPSTGVAIQMINKKMCATQQLHEAIQSLLSFRVQICICIGTINLPLDCIPPQIQMIRVVDEAEAFEICIHLGDSLVISKWKLSQSYMELAWNDYVSLYYQETAVAFAGLLPIPTIAANILLSNGLQRLSYLNVDDIKEISPLSNEEAQAVINFMDDNEELI